MALPLSRSTTYIATSTPSIKAQDLNDLQDYQAHVYNGTRSLKAIVVDGTGGAVTTPVAGTIKASAVGATANAPGPAFSRYSLYRDLLPLAWFQFRVSALTMQVQAGANISSITRSSTGVYVVTLLTGGTLTDNSYCVLLSGGPSTNGFDGGTIVYYKYFVNSATTITVRHQTTAGVATDVEWASGLVYSL